NLDRERLNLIHPPFAATTTAGLLDHFALAVAIGAWLLDYEEALLRADLAVAAAQFAAPPRCARFRAGAAARLAGYRNFDLDFAVLAVERLVQGNLHVVTQVCPAARPGARAAAAEGTAEDGFKDVAKIAEVGVRPAAAHALIEGRMTVAIVCC